MTPRDAVAAVLDTCLADPFPEKLGVAVSGGSDSLALMLILSEICKGRGADLFSATVDHNLRSGAADEARFVADVSALHGIDHSTLLWEGWDGQGNLQARARSARFELLAEWAHRRGIDHVCLGHTSNDQAETILMRLARGSGVDGLSGMRPVREVNGVSWIRPALQVGRQDLRDWLNHSGQSWCDDPSNSDIRFDRVRARRLLEEKAVPGLDAGTLIETARRMAAAKSVLNQAAATAAASLIEIEAGDVVLAASPFFDLADDTRWRLLAHCLCWVSGNDYRPRFKALRALESALASRRVGTLHGCLVTPKFNALHVGRELAALKDVHAFAPGVWDGRWKISGSGHGKDEFRVAALGHLGLLDIPNWRETGLRRETLLASPGVYKNDDLVAAPVAGWAQNWSARLIKSKEQLIETLLSR